MSYSTTLTPAPVVPPVPTEIHVFEKAGLGKAPYTLLGIESRTYQSHRGALLQPGGSCMFCATGIVYFFWLRSADGKKFYVGSDCILKSGDLGLSLLIEPHIRAHEREVRIEREKYYITEFGKFLAEVKPDYFSSQVGPHPSSYWSRQGRTMGDYQKYVYDHAGLTARARMARRILIDEGILKSHNRSAKRMTAEEVASLTTEEKSEAIYVRKTLFRVIAEADNENLFTL